MLGTLHCDNRYTHELPADPQSGRPMKRCWPAYYTPDMMNTDQFQRTLQWLRRYTAQLRAEDVPDINGGRL